MRLQTQKNPLLWMLLFAFVSITYSQSDCSQYYPLTEGAKFQYTMYDKKGKMEGTSDYSVSEVNASGGATNATMYIALKDKKGKETFATNYKFSCKGDKVVIDYHSLIPGEMFKAYEGMEVNITGTDLELPNNLKVGQELADANVAIKIDMGGMSMDMTVNQVNRKVEKKESVTTPAGTFECLVLYSDTESKMMMANQSFPSRVWLSEGVGMIKQETWNKNGKLLSSMVLTSHSK
ncbi:MAG: hypothetical protein AAGC43_10805 [Bacteroidota bacterium]